MRIRHEVEKISLLEQEWGWNPPKRVFEQILEAARQAEAAHLATAGSPCRRQARVIGCSW